MEELLLTQRLDLLIQPIQQGGVALGHSGGYGVIAAQCGNAHHIAGVLHGIGQHLGVIVGPCHAVAVLQCILGRCIGIVLLQLDVGIILGQVGLGGRTGNNDHLIVLIPVLQRGDVPPFRRNNAQCYIHVGQREVHFLGPSRGYGKVGKNHIYLAGLEVFNAVGRLGGDEIHLNTQILRQPPGKVHIVALILAVFIHIAKGVLIGEYPDIDGPRRLDLLQCAIPCFIFIGCVAAIAAGCHQYQHQYCHDGCDPFSCAFHCNFSFL